MHPPCKVHTPEYGTCDESQNATTNEQCVVQGLSADDYAANYGITAEGDAVTINFATMSP